VEVSDYKCCPEIHNCKVYDPDTCGECTQLCDDSQTENHNAVCVNIIEFCDNYSDDGTCNFCAANYQVAVDDGKVCVPQQDHCEKHLNTGDCQTCSSGFIILSDDTATTTTTTTTTTDNLDKCVPIIDQCIT
jgi:hypothetical protein